MSTRPKPVSTSAKQEDVINHGVMTFSMIEKQALLDMDQLIAKEPTAARATQAMGDAGKSVDGELLQYLSPLGWEHINLTGDYVWRQSRRLEDGKFRPLRLPGKP